MTIFLVALFCSTSTALVAFLLTSRQQKHHRALKKAVQNMSQLEHAGLSREVDKELGANFNRNIQAILTQFRIAEQRGLDWEKALDAVDDSVCIIDESGRIIRANLTFARRLGMKIQDTIGQPASRFTIDKKNEVNPIADAIRFDRTVSQSIKTCRLGDELKLTCSPMTRINGSRQFIVVVRDAARVSVKRNCGLEGLRDILNAAPVAAFVAEPNSGAILEINPAFIETFGISSPGISADDLLAGDNTVQRISLRDAIQLGTQSPLSVRLNAADSRMVEAKLSCVLRRDAEGAPSATLVMVSAVNSQAFDSDIDTLLTPRADLAAFTTIAVGDLH